MWQEYLLFLLRTVTIVVAVAFVVMLIAAAASRARSGSSDEKGRIVTEDLGKRLERRRKQLQEAVLPDRKAVRRWRKQQKAADKAEKAARKASAENQEGQQPKVWVLDFKGDIQASATKGLAESVTALLGVAKAGDTVLVRLESPGGLVPGYGLAASQLARIKSQGLTLWACVDKVAASGGYMMACVADRIHAAPFAIVGSIGVVAQVPNFNRLLKRNDIDIELHTAGDFKRTLTVFGENTKAGREKFREQLEATHQLFKQHVAEARPSLDIDAVAQGEYWYGHDALEKGLVDELTTSEDVLLRLSESHQLVRVAFEVPKPLAKKVSMGVAGILEQVFDRFVERTQPLR